MLSAYKKPGQYSPSGSVELSPQATISSANVRIFIKVVLFIVNKLVPDKRIIILKKRLLRQR